jgi:prefoldin subunit 5
LKTSFELILVFNPSCNIPILYNQRLQLYFIAFIMKRVGKKVNREEDDFIQDLRARNNVLQKEKKTLQGKLKNASLTLKKYKQELQSLKSRYGIGNSNRRSLVKRSMSKESNDVNSGCKMGIDDVDVPCQYDEDVNIVLSQLQERLLETESEINSLREENKHLRTRKTEAENHFENKCFNQVTQNDEVSLGATRELSNYEYAYI